MSWLNTIPNFSYLKIVWAESPFVTFHPVVKMVTEATELQDLKAFCDSDKK